jgi:hypothetical protein
MWKLESASYKSSVETEIGVGIGSIAWLQILDDANSRALTYIGDRMKLLIECSREHLDRMCLLPACDGRDTRQDNRASQHDRLNQQSQVRITREQRVAQLQRVAAEFCTLDFNEVNASEQGALTLRMLAVARSFEESTTFYDRDVRSVASRAELIGLDTIEIINMTSAIRRAAALCESRRYRDAFDILQKLLPTFKKRLMDPERLHEQCLGSPCGKPEVSARCVHKHATEGKFRTDAEKRGRLRRQVEYYFSDANLAKDEFFLKLTSEREDGWVDIKHVMDCPIIQMRGATTEEVLACLSESTKLEIRKGLLVSIRKLPIGKRCAPQRQPRHTMSADPTKRKSGGGGKCFTRLGNVLHPQVGKGVGKGLTRKVAPWAGKGGAKEINLAGRNPFSQKACTGKGKGDAGKGKSRLSESSANKKCTFRGSTLEESGGPKPGMTVEKCRTGDLTRLRQLWSMRGGNGNLLEAWKVDNPLRTYHFMKRRERLKLILGREADGLEGFHGTHPDAVISICENGFDSSKRSGQVFGAGEYFAKDPSISIGYCRGGQYMLVCRLTLGVESSTPSNGDGDHIWVAENGYYVIREPEQVLPQYIVKFSVDQCFESPELRLLSSTQEGDIAGYSPSAAFSDLLEDVLRHVKWSTKCEAEIKPVPPQRQCLMSNPHATVLWMGFLHGHLSDEVLEADVRRFLKQYAPEYMNGLRVQIVKGHFKKAHAILQSPIPRELVHKLNSLPFVENGTSRTICVDDGHGSPLQQCPKFIAGYCRGQNLRFTHPCWCSHHSRPTERARYQLTPISLDSAKGVELSEKFMASGSFHNGSARIVGIKAISNEVLSKCHEEYRMYLTTKHMEEPVVQELYHGTNNNILDIVYTHGLQPPSDMRASDMCPTSGGKGLCTSLCNNDCKYCTEKHEWDKCHMYGLGIYLADLAQKSHKYVSQPRTSSDGCLTYRMAVCSVLGKSFQLEGHLTSQDAMHDVVNVRALTDDLIDDMVDRCQVCHPSGELGCENLETAEKSDLLFVRGLGNAARRGWSVAKSEYIAFHPHQCLPKYEIEYEVR